MCRFAFNACTLYKCYMRMKCTKMTCLVFTKSRGNPSNVPITPAAKPDDNSIYQKQKLNTKIEHLC